MESRSPSKTLWTRLACEPRQPALYSRIALRSRTQRSSAALKLPVQYSWASSTFTSAPMAAVPPSAISAPFGTPGTSLTARAVLPEDLQPRSRHKCVTAQSELIPEAPFASRQATAVLLDSNPPTDV